MTEEKIRRKWVNVLPPDSLARRRGHMEAHGMGVGNTLRRRSSGGNWLGSCPIKIEKGHVRVLNVVAHRT